MKQLLLFLSALLICNTILIAQNTEFSINEDYSNIRKIEIIVISSNINIISTTKDVVHLDGKISWENPKYKLFINAEVKGNLLKIKVEYPKKSKNNKVKGILVLEVPNNIDLKLNSTSGGVQVSGTSENRMEIKSVSGEILCNEINGDICVNNVSGKINISSVSGNVNCKSISGDMFINQIEKNFEGSSISGDFYLSDIKGKIETQSIVGKVH